MTSPEPFSESPQNPQGLNEDVPCPKCQYNLRGLTVPRCPECGFTFAWSDIPGFRPPPRSEAPTWPVLVIVLAIIGAGFFGLAIGSPEAIGGIAFVLTAIGVPAFALSAVQTCLELLTASAWIGGITRKRFRAWWEGVLIGYGVCALTLLATGHTLLVFNDAYAWRLSGGIVPLLLLTTTESVVIQWWVVRRRMRQWEAPIASKDLLYACLIAKVIMGAPWTLLSPFFLRRL